MASTRIGSDELPYASVCLPTEDGRGSFLIERINGGRFAVRAGKVSLFVTFGEAQKIIAILETLRVKR